MPFSPFFRSPFSDLTSDMISHQLLGRCAIQEMEYMECLEAYGLDRGMRKKACIALFEDYKECHTMNKQFSRFMAMVRERARQIRSGKLQGDKKYVTPVIDSY